MKKYIKIFTTKLQVAIAYRGHLLVWILSAGIWVGAMPFVWLAIKGGAETLSGFDTQMIVTYFFFVPMVEAITLSHMEEAISEDIKDGGLNKYLTRPFNYLMGRGIEEGSWHVVRFAITASIMFVVSFFIRDYLSIGLTADSLPLLVTSLFLGAVIGYQVSCVLGITSFFMTESWGLRQFWWMLQTFAVGFLIPISFYPEWAQTLISYSPFPLMMFVPIELIQGIETFSHAQAIFLGLGWIVIIQCIIMTTWRIGIRRYEGTGA